ncbi:MAG TPA: sugar-binding protein, partial [Anaerolinea sp.]|nr:sugar-binding protein [Anaerolinea sp.]
PPPTQAPPPTVTNTSKPPTAAPPPSRPGAHAEATFMGTAPTIDGDWSEWKKVAREYPATNVVFGKGNWTGEDDLAGSYYVGWDLTYLYLAAKVRDDKYVQVSTGENIFKGDSLELILDTNLLGDFYNDSLSADDYQIGISPGHPTIGDDNPEAYLWFPSSKAGKLSGVNIAELDEGTQYRVEAAIPWSVFGITPAKGMRMGFAFSVSDDDLTGEAAQQSMVSSAAGRNLADPTTWGEVTLK